LTTKFEEAFTSTGAVHGQVPAGQDRPLWTLSPATSRSCGAATQEGGPCRRRGRRGVRSRAWVARLAPRRVVARRAHLEGPGNGYGDELVREDATRAVHPRSTTNHIRWSQLGPGGGRPPKAGVAGSNPAGMASTWA